MSDGESDTFLGDVWCLYFHDPNDDNWERDATKLISTISTVDDWVQVHHQMRDMWHKGMFFLMREHIRPEWEDEHCRAGGCISYKIMKPEVANAWFELSCKALGETLLKKGSTKDWSKICGVSISPKRNYCILRVWVGVEDWGHISHYDITVPSYSTIMFRRHLDETGKA